ncbi:hypothetical protein HanIR_Chr09g0407541 [Helianthus annuus]|nr:hypothetical protein HanIR_Chr09g0407541 [Helianthus annuus]
MKIPPPTLGSFVIKIMANVILENKLRIYSQHLLQKYFQVLYFWKNFTRVSSVTGGGHAY